MVPPSNPDGLRKAAIIALYPIVWVLAHKAAVAMNVGPGVSVWYPPAGLTFAFLLSFPRFWPLTYVGIGYVVLLGPYAVTAPGAWLSWLIPPTGYVAGVALLRRWLDGPLDLSRQAHIHRFIAASLATPATVAALNVLNFCADGAIPWSEYGPLAARFFIGDALGIVTLAPTLLLLNRPWRSHFRQKDGRMLFLGLLAAALILYLEVAELLLGHDQGRFSYFVMLPVAWNAVAFGVLGAALADCIDSFDECLTWTKLNCDWLIENRNPRKTRMLNVMQGISVDGPDGALAWYEGIKGYCDRSKWGENAFDGWAFGGMAVRTRSAILRTIARMLQDGVLGSDSNQRWIHMLGITGPKDVAFFTMLQRALRKVLRDDGFTVSCDASTPNSEMGKRRQYYAESAQGIKLRKTLDTGFLDYHGDDTPDLAQFVRDWVGMHPDALTFDVAWFKKHRELLDWDFDLSRCAEDEEIEIGMEFVKDSPEFLVAAYDRLVEVPEFKAFAVEQFNAHPGYVDFLFDRMVEGAKAIGTSSLAEHLTQENYWKLVEMKPPKDKTAATQDDGSDEDGTRPDRLTPMGYIVHTFISQEMYLRYTYEGAATEIENWPELADELAEALVSETPDTKLSTLIVP